MADVVEKQKIHCAVCDRFDPAFRWSDAHGEGMCFRCGCPYQLLHGDEVMEKAGYPYLLLEDWQIPIAREYWKETNAFVYQGRQFGGEREGWPEFVAWLRAKHTELFESKPKEPAAAG